MAKDPIDRVVNSLANRFGVTSEALLGHDRTPDATTARHIALLICWRALGCSQSEIAARFGGRKHTGVAYGALKASRLLVQDPMAYGMALDVLKEIGLPPQALPVRNVDEDDGGLVAVHSRTGGQLSFFGRVSEGREIDMALTTGSHLLAALAPKLDAAVTNGCRIRLVLTHPRIARGSEDSRTYWCDQSDFHSLLEWSFAQLKALKLGFVQGCATGSLEVRLRQRPPTCNLILLDDAVARWTPLLPMQDSKESPSFDFANVDGSIFPQLRAAFESMWDDGDFTCRESELSYEPARGGSTGGLTAKKPVRRRSAT